jgi:hypothetical protein
MVSHEILRVCSSAFLGTFEGAKDVEVIIAVKEIKLFEVVGDVTFMPLAGEEVLFSI